MAKTTTLVKSYRDITGLLHTYTYDKNGDITFEVIGEGSAIQYKSYLYDSQNRLTRYNDSALDITVVYEYDARGNILSATTYDYYAYNNTIHTSAESTKTYGYTNNVLKDAVTSINGETITYDSSYNPLKWTGGRTLTWVQGRRLESVTGSAGTVSYVYDENGIRVAKSSTDGRSTQYYVADGTYLGERTVIDGTEYLITYLYGDSGVVGIEVNGTKYFFVKNVQGDIIGIIDSTGAVIANYAYDAYGFCYSVTDASGNNITSASHIANLNPFRYRSYMYDSETGFYYLTTRYYDPDIGRFLNADAYVSTGQGLDGHNMFAYCGNNPVSRGDSCGTDWKDLVLGPAGVLGISAYKNVKKNGSDVLEDIENFDLDNESEDVVLESNYFSAYKGKLVVRKGIRNRSGSFGVMFITRNSDKSDSPKDVVRHEYGHTKQFDRLGTAKYLVFVAIPSVLTPTDRGNEWYYTRPWEATADYYGGVTNPWASQEQMNEGFEYLDAVENCSIIYPRCTFTYVPRLNGGR